METKTISKPLLLAMAFLLGVFVISCSKDPSQGPQGHQGVPGNASLKTYVYNIDSAQWKMYDNMSFYANISAIYITQNIYDSGTVLVYMSNGSNGWNALPFTIPYDILTYSSVYSVGEITLWILTGSTYTDPFNFKVKVVVIQGSARKKAYIPPYINTKNYYEVKNYFHLAD